MFTRMAYGKERLRGRADYDFREDFSASGEVAGTLEMTQK